MNANEIAGLLADFVDTLIPGDGSWPAASRVGVQGLLAARLVETDGEAAIARLAGLLGGADGFAGQSEDVRTAIVAGLERAHPRFFAVLREAVYLAYYESPAVAERIHALGYAYELRPHLTGYAMPPPDAERDRPRHRRGSYVRTEDVRRLDLSAIRLADGAKKEQGHGG